MLQQFFTYLDLWFKLVTFIVSLFLTYQLRGGKIMFPILLIGIVSAFGFLTSVVGNPEMVWFTGALQSLVFLVVATWFAYIFRP